MVFVLTWRHVPNYHLSTNIFQFSTPFYEALSLMIITCSTLPRTIKFISLRPYLEFINIKLLPSIALVLIRLSEPPWCRTTTVLWSVSRRQIRCRLIVISIWSWRCVVRSVISVNQRSIAVWSSILIIWWWSARACCWEERDRRIDRWVRCFSNWWVGISICSCTGCRRWKWHVCWVSHGIRRPWIIVII